MNSQTKYRHAKLLSIFSLTIACLGFVFAAQAEIPGVRDHINRGNVFLSRHAYEEAIKEYDEALKLEPTNSIAKGNIVLAHNNWGINLVNRKQYKEAMEQWNTCLELSPGYKDAVRNIALLRATLERANQLDLIGEGGDVVWEGDKVNKPSKGKSTKVQATPSTSEPNSIKILTPGIKQNPESGLQSYDMTNMSTSQSTSSAPHETPRAQPTQPISTPTGGSSGNSMDEQLGQIETKVYGSRQTNLPVIQRLQKLENDAAGHARTGTIKERIDFLRQTWGL